MGHFSMEIYAPTGSNLNGNQQSEILRCSSQAICPIGADVGQSWLFIAEF